MRMTYDQSAFGQRSSGVLVLAGVLCACGLAVADAPNTPYEVISLGRLGFLHDPGGIGFTASTDGVVGTFDLNGRHQVAYAREIDRGGGVTEVRPFVYLLTEDYGAAAGQHDLSLADGSGGDRGAAFDINDAGVVVGQIEGAAFAEGHAVAWLLDAGGASFTPLRVVLPEPQGATWSRAIRITESEVASGPDPVEWTILVQYGAERECPASCEGGATKFEEYVQSYTVTIDEAGVTGTPVVLSSDSDCFPTVRAWAIAETFGSITMAGSDFETNFGPGGTGCYNPAGAPCGETQSALRWQGSTLLTELGDYDGAAFDDQASEGRAVSVDGGVVGFGRMPEGVFCEPGALYWPAGSVAPIDLDAVAPSPFGAARVTRAEGVNSRSKRTVVGWDEGFDEAIV